RHYAKASEVKEIRKIIVEILTKTLNGIEVEKLVKILSTDNLVREIETKCSSIYPVVAMVRKVKTIKNMQCIRNKIKGEEEEAKNEFEGCESD
ncbi:RS3A, partial [Enterospora canceri]